MLRQICLALGPATTPARASQLTSPWYRSLLAFNPQAGLANVSCSTLGLHGAADAQVPAATNFAVL